MGLIDRMGRVVRANLNRIVGNPEDPEKTMDVLLIEMRQNVAQAIANQARAERQYRQNQSQANSWQQRAQRALQEGDERLACLARERKKYYMDAANALKPWIDSQSDQVDSLKRSLAILEGKIAEAKAKKKHTQGSHPDSQGSKEG